MLTADDNYREILQLLRSLEDKLTTTINAGLATVNLAISTIQDQHNKSLLEQERRNASFADRMRLEDVAKHVHDNAGEINTLTYRVAELEKCDEKHDQELNALSHRIDHDGDIVTERGFKLLGSTAGYLVTALLMILVALLTYFLSHGAH